MLKVFAIEPKTVAIESDGDSITFNIAKCPQYQVGLSLFHTDDGATEHVAAALTNLLANFGVKVQLPEIPQLQEPAKKQEPVASE